MDNEDQDTNERIEELESEIETLRERVSELEEENVKLVNDFRASRSEEPIKRRGISEYQVGDFVSVVVPLKSDMENGKVIEHTNGKNSVIVATALGEITIADPSRIRKQSDA